MVRKIGESGWMVGGWMDGQMGEWVVKWVTDL